MAIVLRLLISVNILLLCSCSSTPTKEAVSESIKNIMPPNFEVVSVTPLKEVPGLLEVAVKLDKQPIVLYMDNKAKYVLSGSLLDPKTKLNLTIEAQKKIK